MLKCWGSGGVGLTGDSVTRGAAVGTMGDSLPAASLGTGRTAVKFAAGRINQCAILDNGGVKCWGYNYGYGEVGYNPIASEYIGDAPGEIGDSLPYVDLGPGRTAVDVTVGDSAACAILDNGKVKCWGRNHICQLGKGSTGDTGNTAGAFGAALPYTDLGTGRTATKIKTSFNSQVTCALLDNQKLKCWGNNNQAELGNGVSAGSFGCSPVTVGDSMPYLDFGTVSTVSDFFVNGNGGCALLTDGNTKCWGHASRSGPLYSKDLAWGTQASHIAAPRTTIFPSGSIKKVSQSASTTCALSDYGAVRCWGAAGPSLGNPGAPTIYDYSGSSSYLADIDFGSAGQVVDITSTSSAHCAVFSDGRVKCWGVNSAGELGYGDTIDRGATVGSLGNSLPYVDLGTGRTVKQLVGGNYSSVGSHCAILDNDKVKCWGDGSFGKLGYESTANVGNLPGQMGDNLPYVDLGTGRTAKYLSMGLTVCAILDNDSVKCWGYANGKGAASGDMGDNLAVINTGGRKPIQIEVSHQFGTCILFDDETVRCIDGYATALTPTLGSSLNFGSGKKVIKLSAGNTAICAQLDTNEVKCLGDNTYGQLGHGQFNSDITQNSMMFGDSNTDFATSWPNISF